MEARKPSSGFEYQTSPEDTSAVIASLRRQNEDLREKVATMSHGHRKRPSEHDQAGLDRLINQECQDLRVTISKMERLLDAERDERNQMEKKSVEMLTELRKNWQAREETRIQSLSANLEKVEAKKIKLENELRDAVRIIEGQTSQLESAQEVKESLKTKLKEYKARLEESVAKYGQARAKIDRLRSDHSDVVQELESKASTSVKEKTFILDEFEGKVDELKEEVQSLKKELASAKSVARDQKETISYLKRAKAGSESDNLDQAQEIRNVKFEFEQENAGLKSQLKASKEESQLSAQTIREQNDKLDTLEKVLVKFERKLAETSKPVEIVPKPRKILQEIQPPPASPKVEKCDCQEAKEEAKMKGIEVRMMERQVEKLEERVKFLRDVMIKEHKDARTKAESELKEAQEKLEQVEKTHVEVKDLKEANQAREKRLNGEIETLEKKVQQQKDQERELKSTKAELEQVKTTLANLKRDTEEMADLKANFNTLKTTCVELQGQIGDYEHLVDKLERKSAELKKSNEKLTHEIKEITETVSSVKIENNSLQSKLIFAESQLKEIKAKHDDIEHMYQEEERNWNSRLGHLNTAKQDQSDALVKLKNQLNALAKNYDLVNDEAELLRGDNLTLKEERSQFITNMSTMKDSNLKLNTVMEEMLEKISKRNKDIQILKDELWSIREEKDKREMETHTQISQLRKLVDHLQAKSDAMKVKGKNKEKHGDQNYALSYEEIQEELIQERHKVRTLMEENRRLRSGSPVRK